MESATGCVRNASGGGGGGGGAAGDAATSSPPTTALSKNARKKLARLQRRKDMKAAKVGREATRAKGRVD